MITLTQEVWHQFAPHCPPNYTAALFDNISLLEGAGILDNERRWCHFAATVYEETGDFSEIRESLKYTTCRVLRSTWPSRFGHKSDDELQTLLHNERNLADAVYAGRMGNRPGTGDAFDYRGGGWIQTTGRSAVDSYCKKLGIESSPSTLDDPVLTLKFAVLEWTEAKCNKWADENDIVKVAKAINTGSAASNVVPVGMSERRAAFERAWKYWGDAVDIEANSPPSETVATNVTTVAPNHFVNTVTSPTVWSILAAAWASVYSGFEKAVDVVFGLLGQAGDIKADADAASEPILAILSTLKVEAAAIGTGIAVVCIVIAIVRHVDLKGKKSP